MGVKLIKFFDKFLGRPLCTFLGMFNFSKKRGIPLKENVRNILIIQLWGIGETILTVPAIKALKKEYRESSVEVLCTERNQDIYSGYDFIDDVKVVKLGILHLLGFIIKNHKRYDIVIDMEEYLNISALISFFVGKLRIGYSHGSRSRLYSKKVRYNDQQHVSQTFFDLVKVLGVKGSVEKLERLNYNPNDEKVVDLALRNEGINKGDFIIGIAPGAAESSKSRMWLKERFAELIDLIPRKRKNTKIILVGADYERNLCDSIIRLANNKNVFNFAGNFTLKQTFYLTSRCSIFIGNDSGPMHIAAAMDIRTIGLFGPNLPIRFAPLNKKSSFIYKKVHCSPCINVHKGKVPECYYKKDNENYQKCMKEIKVEDVLGYI